MEKIRQHTFKQRLEGSTYDSRLFELAKEAGIIYSKSLENWWTVFNEEEIFMREFELQAFMKDKLTRTLLGSDSYIASIQQACEAVRDYFKAKKAFEKNPSKFTGKPMPPTKSKFLQILTFKEDQIHIKKGFLLLSLAKGQKPLKYRWSLPKPNSVIINYDKFTGWFLNCTFKDNILQLENLNPEKVLAIDLGSKRIAATFDGTTTTLHSGKYIRSLVRLDNKIEGETKTKLSKLKKNSRKSKKILRAKRRVKNMIRNKKKDVLFKTAKKIVDNAIKNNIGTIVFGDCASIHDETNLGKVNNQQVQQNPEQQLRKYVTESFESIGGTVKIVPEHYTSQECPHCGHRHKCQNRDFICPRCNFMFDRDGVGAINIYKQNVSFDMKVSNVVGALTAPIGERYRDCLVSTRRTSRL